MTEILNGKILAKTIRAKAKQRVETMSNPPGLAVILVGDDPASHLYVKLKEEAAREIGLYVERHEYPTTATTKDIMSLIKKLNKRQEIHGILLQMPLPGNQDTNTLIAAIDPNKDVDGFHPQNRKLLLASTPRLVPPTALAIMRLLQATRLSLNEKTAVILGNSAIFAEPIIELLRDAGVTAAFITRETPGLAAITRASDILIVALGVPHVITRDMVKPSGVVIDVGTTKVDTKTLGDASPELVEYSGFLSPVPGGVGPLTVAYLLLNVIKAREVQSRGTSPA